MVTRDRKSVRFHPTKDAFRNFATCCACPSMDSSLVLGNPHAIDTRGILANTSSHCMLDCWRVDGMTQGLVCAQGYFASCGRCQDGLLPPLRELISFCHHFQAVCLALFEQHVQACVCGVMAQLEPMRLQCCLGKLRRITRLWIKLEQRSRRAQFAIACHRCPSRSCSSRRVRHRHTIKTYLVQATDLAGVLHAEVSKRIRLCNKALVHGRRACELQSVDEAQSLL
mmetsp:Transcript_63680/g.125984  ORF Transcript_63680/g.125984 Transcript_63680/m.125984 type:complete len:226 (-) Transcript_63680:1054-1731(-)